MGDLPDLAFSFMPRNAAVKRQTRPNEIEAVFAAEVDSGRVCQTAPSGWHQSGHVPKALQLLRVELAVLVGAGKMAVQCFDRETFERSRLVRPQSKSIHSGVDHDVARSARSDFLPASDLLHAVEHRPGGGT